MPLARSGWLNARFRRFPSGPAADNGRAASQEAALRSFGGVRLALLHSIGHSNRSFADLLALLRANGIAALADIRHFTRSRANPQFNADVFAPALAQAGIAYEHIAELGGRRSSKRKDSP